MEEDQSIVMETIMVVYAIKKKSQANMFRALMTGDRVRFSIPIKEVGMNSRGTHAAYIKCENLRNGENTISTFNQLPKILDSFIFHKEVE